MFGRWASRVRGNAFKASNGTHAGNSFLFTSWFMNWWTQLWSSVSTGARDKPKCEELLTSGFQQARWSNVCQKLGQHKSSSKHLIFANSKVDISAFFNARRRVRGQQRKSVAFGIMDRAGLIYSRLCWFPCDWVYMWVPRRLDSHQWMICGTKRTVKASCRRRMRQDPRAYAITHACHIFLHVPIM